MLGEDHPDTLASAQRLAEVLRKWAQLPSSGPLCSALIVTVARWMSSVPPTCMPTVGALRQIGAELGVHWSTVSQQLRQTGITMRRGATAHPASTQQILELRDQGLTWNEIAEQVDMTASGAWSRYRRARPPKSPRLGRWQQVLADALDQNLAIGVRAALVDHLGRAPTRAELNAARRAAHSLAALGHAQVLHVPGADADGEAGDRNYLVLAKPNVIMNDIRLRGLGVCGKWRSRSEEAAQSRPDRSEP